MAYLFHAVMTMVPDARASCWHISCFLLLVASILERLTHWGRATNICVSKLTIIGSDNGLSPDRRQAIIWTNAGLLLIEPVGTNFCETLVEIHTFSFTKMHLKMSFGKRRLFCLGLNVLNDWGPGNPYMLPWTGSSLLNAMAGQQYPTCTHYFPSDP